MRISIVTPIWKRPILTRLYLIQLKEHLRYSAFAHPDVHLGAVIVGSEGHLSEELVRSMDEPRFYYLEHENQPLGDKFNAGIRYAFDELGSDYVLIMGSDQFFLSSFMDVWIEHALAGDEYVGVLDLFMYDSRTASAVYWPGYSNHRAGDPIGPGRLIHRSLVPGALYESLRRDLDATADARLPKPVLVKGERHLFTSIKTDESITPMDRFPEAGPVDATVLYPVLPS